MRFNKKTFLLTCLWMSLFSLSLYALATKTSVTPNENSTEIDLPLEDVQRFATAIAEIQRYYIEPVNNDKLFNYAISGMLSNLDPHSDYLDAEAIQDLEMATTGKFGGIGIE